MRSRVAVVSITAEKEEVRRVGIKSKTSVKGRGWEWAFIQETLSLCPVYQKSTASSLN